MEGRMDRHVVGLTDEKTDEQRDIKTKQKQGRHTDYIYCHADLQIYYFYCCRKVHFHSTGWSL